MRNRDVLRQARVLRAIALERDVDTAALQWFLGLCHYKVAATVAVLAEQNRRRPEPDAAMTRAEVRAVLIDAEGKVFSYGGDVSVFADAGDELPGLILRWTSDLHMGIARLQRIDAPIVTAVHGVCAGGMAAFVAGSDVLVGADDAMLVAAYTGIGYSCDASASITLSRRMGLARAPRYLLLNPPAA